MAARSFVRSGVPRALSQTITRCPVAPSGSAVAATTTTIRAQQATGSPLSFRSILESQRGFHATVPRAKKLKQEAHSSRADFAELDVLGSAPVPSTSVDVCLYDGFGLNSGITISGGDGALMVDGEVFKWRPWEAKGSMNLANEKGQFDVPPEAFAVFDLIWPRPDLLVIGVGKTNMPLSPEIRKYLAELGVRVEVLDTRNAAAQFNLLATERGVSDVAAALIPIGWKEGEGAA